MLSIGIYAVTKLNEYQLIRGVGEEQLINLSDLNKRLIVEPINIDFPEIIGLPQELNTQNEIANKEKSVDIFVLGAVEYSNGTRKIFYQNGRIIGMMNEPTETEEGFLKINAEAEEIYITIDSKWSDPICYQVITPYETDKLYTKPVIFCTVGSGSVFHFAFLNPDNLNNVHTDVSVLRMNGFSYRANLCYGEINMGNVMRPRITISHSFAGFNALNNLQSTSILRSFVLFGDENRLYIIDYKELNGISGHYPYSSGCILSENNKDYFYYFLLYPFKLANDKKVDNTKITSIFLVNDTFFDKQNTLLSRQVIFERSRSEIYISPSAPEKFGPRFRMFNFMGSRTMLIYTYFDSEGVSTIFQSKVCKMLPSIEKIISKGYIFSSCKTIKNYQSSGVVGNFSKLNVSFTDNLRRDTIFTLNYIEIGELSSNTVSVYWADERTINSAINEGFDELYRSVDSAYAEQLEFLPEKEDFVYKRAYFGSIRKIFLNKKNNLLWVENPTEYKLYDIPTIQLTERIRPNIGVNKIIDTINWKVPIASNSLIDPVEMTVFLVESVGHKIIKLNTFQFLDQFRLPVGQFIKLNHIVGNVFGPVIEYGISENIYLNKHEIINGISYTIRINETETPALTSFFIGDFLIERFKDSITFRKCQYAQNKFDLNTTCFNSLGSKVTGEMNLTDIVDENMGIYVLFQQNELALILRFDKLSYLISDVQLLGRNIKQLQLLEKTETLVIAYIDILLNQLIIHKLPKANILTLVGIREVSTVHQKVNLTQGITTEFYARINLKEELREISLYYWCLYKYKNAVYNTRGRVILQKSTKIASHNQKISSKLTKTFSDYAAIEYCLFGEFIYKFHMLPEGYILDMQHIIEGWSIVSHLSEDYFLVNIFKVYCTRHRFAISGIAGDLTTYGIIIGAPGNEFDISKRIVQAFNPGCITSHYFHNRKSSFLKCEVNKVYLNKIISNEGTELFIKFNESLKLDQSLIQIDVRGAVTSPTNFTQSFTTLKANNSLILTYNRGKIKLKVTDRLEVMATTYTFDFYYNISGPLYYIYIARESDEMVMGPGGKEVTDFCVLEENLHLVNYHYVGDRKSMYHALFKAGKYIFTLRYDMINTVIESYDEYFFKQKEVKIDFRCDDLKVVIYSHDCSSTIDYLIGLHCKLDDSDVFLIIPWTLQKGSLIGKILKSEEKISDFDLITFNKNCSFFYALSVSSLQQTYYPEFPLKGSVFTDQISLAASKNISSLVIISDSFVFTIFYKIVTDTFYFAYYKERDNYLELRDYSIVKGNL